MSFSTIYENDLDYRDEFNREKFLTICDNRYPNAWILAKCNTSTSMFLKTLCRQKCATLQLLVCTM